jgi:hypothetical protein
MSLLRSRHCLYSGGGASLTGRTAVVLTHGPDRPPPIKSSAVEDLPTANPERQNGHDGQEILAEVHMGRVALHPPRTKRT